MPFPFNTRFSTYDWRNIARISQLYFKRFAIFLNEPTTMRTSNFDVAKQIAFFAVCKIEYFHLISPLFLSINYI